LKGDELDMYYRVHEALAEKMRHPDLIVYLRADTDLLMQRITLRDRPYERNMDPDYIRQVNQSYDDFFLNKDHRTPVLIVETGQLDYVRYPEDLRWVENRIRQALQMAPFQPELPLPNHD
jgi:deoxyguanosine kinase